MIDWLAVTRVYLAAAAIILIGYDIAAASLHGQSATISHILYGISCRYPIVPLTIGVILGHIFWPQVR